MDVGVFRGLLAFERAPVSRPGAPGSVSRSSLFHIISDWKLASRDKPLPAHFEALELPTHCVAYTS